MAYFDYPENKKEWEKELSRLRAEKAKRQNARTASWKPEAKMAEKTGKMDRIPITFEKLVELEFGKKGMEAVQAPIAPERSKEKTKNMGGRSM